MHILLYDLVSEQIPDREFLMPWESWEVGMLFFLMEHPLVGSQKDSSYQKVQDIIGNLEPSAPSLIPYLLKTGKGIGMKLTANHVYMMKLPHKSP